MAKHVAKPDEVDYYKHSELSVVDTNPPATDWMDTPVDMRPGAFIYPAKGKHLEYLGMP